MPQPQSSSCDYSVNNTSTITTKLLLQHMDTKLTDYINKFDLVLEWIVRKFGEDEAFPEKIKNFVNSCSLESEEYVEGSTEAELKPYIKLENDYDLLEEHEDEPVEPVVTGSPMPSFDEIEFSEGNSNSGADFDYGDGEYDNEMDNTADTAGSHSTCPKCNKLYDPLESESLHKCSDKRKHLQLPYKCSQCDKSYAQGTSLRLHINTQHSGLRFECSLCTKGFVQRGSLRRHMQTVHKGEQLPPESKIKLTPKIPIPTVASGETDTATANDEPLSCRLCPLTFPTKFRLDWHIKLVHYPKRQKQKNTSPTGNNNKTFKKFSAKRKRSTRNVTESDSMNSDDHLKPYICEYLTCDKRFKHQSELKRHAQIHSDEKNHVCEVCGQGFTMLGSLTRHLRKVHETTIIVNSKNIID